MSKDKLKEIASEVVELLKRHDYVIQRYDAYSTSSVYLKLDYGLCNSIRIGDHKGKKGLQYRYNLMLHHEQYSRQTTKEGWLRHYYPVSQLEDMIEQIRRDKEAKIRKCVGINRYRFLMDKNREAHQQDKGFWRESKLV